MNEETLKEIERLGGLFMSPQEICLLLNIDFEKHFLGMEFFETEASKAYKVGKLKSKVEIRENIIKLAKHGSPQAQLLAKEFMNIQDNEELKQ